MKKHFDLLGLQVRDCVTGLKGIVTTVSFDLYGCVQVVLTPISNKGELKESTWFDVARLKILDTKPVMPQPDFIKGYIADGKKGCADKPSFK